MRHWRGSGTANESTVPVRLVDAFPEETDQGRWHVRPRYFGSGRKNRLASSSLCPLLLCEQNLFREGAQLPLEASQDQP